MSASKRTVINIILLISIIFIPWWVSVIIVLFANISGYFFEGIVYGFLMDSMYGINLSHTFMFSFLVLSVLVPIIKERVRLGAK